MRTQLTVSLDDDLIKKLPPQGIGRDGARSAWVRRAIESYLVACANEGEQVSTAKDDSMTKIAELLDEQEKKQLTRADEQQKSFLQIGKHGEMNPAFRDRQEPPDDEKKARKELLKEREARAQVASKCIVLRTKIQKLQKWWI